MKPLLSLYLLTAWLPHALAQEAQPEPPLPPLIAQPPEYGCWTIEIIGAKAASGKEAVNEKVRCVKTKEIKRDTFSAPGGQTREIWYVGKFALSKYEGSEKVSLEDAAGLSKQRGSKTGSLICGAGFPGFAWLDLRYYKGVVKVGGRPCYHFQMAQSEDAPGESVVEAWIEVATKYPVAIKAEGAVYAYEFQQAPAGMLQLPAEYAEAVRRHEAHLKQLSFLEKGR